MGKILVVDDQLSIRHLLDALLNLNGYEVILAENGRMGLELYRRECPDVVVLGPNMLDMDGIMVLKDVRKLNPDQPVIIFTGRENAEIKQLARGLVANEMIEQDFPPRRLMGTLKRLLEDSPPSYGDSVAFEARITEGHPITEAEAEVLNERADWRGCAHHIPHLQCDENSHVTNRYICITCGATIDPPLFA
jgi:DNA-binding response OmpR family regulator